MPKRPDNLIVQLTIEVWQEGDQFVSRCVELETTSCGATMGEAVDNIRDAVNLHLTTLEELGERDRFFEAKGVKIQPHKPASSEIAQKFTAAFAVSV